MIAIDNFFSTKSKEFFTVNSLVISGDKIGFKYLANKYVGVFIADKIGRNFRVLLTTVLCTSGVPYKMPGVVPTGLILSNSFSEIFSSFLGKNVKKNHVVKNHVVKNLFYFTIFWTSSK